MTRQQKYKIQTIARYIILIAVGLVMIYPMIWMVGASFKATNAEIFGSIGFIPKEFTLDGYKNGWFASTYQFGRYMVKAYKFVIPKVIEPLFPQPLQHMVFHGFSLRHGLLVCTDAFHAVSASGSVKCASVLLFTNGPGSTCL
ncbi:MAG: hypothetical protein ACLT0W_00495 [Clostridium sp.]